MATAMGTVTAFSNDNLLNAAVISQKTKVKTLTDSLGRFQIEAPAGDVLTLNANGFGQNRRKVQKGADPLVVNMILLKGEKQGGSLQLMDISVKKT